MQTFLPYGDYEATAQTLDNKRLNKQILEGYQILKVLSGASETGAWRNHPAVLMWKGTEHELKAYLDHMIYEANWRGIKTDKNEFNINQLTKQYGKQWGTEQPFWMQDLETLRRVNATHQTSLFNKDSIAYAGFNKSHNSPYNITCCDKCNYYWPTHPLRNAKSAAAVEEHA
jgi:hypothetical protein